MKLISTELGRAALSVDAGELRPLNGIYGPDFFAAIKERYSFVINPDMTLPPEQIDKEGLHFRIGHTVDKKLPVMALSLFDRGLQADAATTEIAELFLDDLLQWAQKELGIRKPVRPPLKLAWSQVIVEFDKPIGNLIKAHDLITQRLANETAVPVGGAGNPGVFRIALNFDATLLPATSSSTDFIIERKIGSPYENERYWCQGPMHTQALIRLLEDIEAAI